MRANIQEWGIPQGRKKKYFMQRKFITNLGLLLLLNLLIKPFWVFGIDRTVQNVVGTADYGFYFTLLNFGFLFNIFLDLGITNFNNKNIAQHNQLLAKHFSGISTLKLLLGFAYMFITVGFGIIWGYRGYQLLLLAWVGFNQFLLSFLMYLRSNISGMLMFRTESFLSVLDRGLMIIIMSVLLWGHVTQKAFKIEWFIAGQSCSYLLTALIAYTIVAYKSKTLQFKWNPLFFRVILRKSFPFALLTLLMMFYNRVDTVLIGKLLPEQEAHIQAGIYAHAYRILDAVNQIAFLFAVLLLPLFSHLIQERKPIKSIVKMSFSLLFAGAFIFAASTAYFSKDIMELLYSTAHLDSSAQVYAVLIFSFVFIATSYVLGTLLTANNNLKALNLLAAISVLISLSLNSLLIPHYQALGSAIANVSAMAFMCIGQAFVIRKTFRVSLSIRYTVRLLFFVIISIGMLYVLKETPLAIAWYWQLFGYMLIALCLALLLRIVSIKALIAFVKDRE